MPNIQTISHKRGTTFSYGGLVKLPAGTWLGRSSLQTQTRRPVGDLVVSLTALPAHGPKGETHALLLECAAVDTAAWPQGTLVGDILFIDAGGLVLQSETFAVNVELGVSSAA